MNTGVIGFAIGMAAGGFMGMLFMAMMAASSDESRCEECRYGKR